MTAIPHRMRLPGIHNIQIHVISNNLINCCTSEKPVAARRKYVSARQQVLRFTTHQGTGCTGKKKNKKGKSHEISVFSAAELQYNPPGFSPSSTSAPETDMPRSGPGFYKPPTFCTAAMQSSKGLSRHLITNYLEHLHEASTWLPQCMCSL